MRKGQLVLKTLEALARVAMSTATVVEAILTSPYGTSYGRLQKRAREIEQEREKAKQKSREQRQIYDLIYRLNRDGLIARKKSGSKLWQLTIKGKNELTTLKKYLAEQPERKSYKKENGSELKIVAFDIPEKYKRRRNWLRAVLKNLGFTMLQKSVWVGKNKLPEEFIGDVHKLGLLSYLEILAVTKSGSLKEITRR